MILGAKKIPSNFLHRYFSLHSYSSSIISAKRYLMIPRLGYNNQLEKTCNKSHCRIQVHYSNQSYNPHCKSIGEICGDKVTQRQGCTPTTCPKDQRTSCYPESSKCGEVKGKGTKPIIEAMPIINEKIDYSKLKCPTSKFEKLSPCPAIMKNDVENEESDEIKAKLELIELPKPPTGPVVLCQCAPPPKLPPGDCPCASAVRDTQSADPTIPCIIKSGKYKCPEQRIFYCPPQIHVASVKNIVK